MALHFLKSSHKLDYLSIAIQFHVSPDRVYRLNHDTIKPVDDKDKQILYELYRRNIRIR